MAIVEKVDGFFIPNVTLIGVGAAKAIPERNHRKLFKSPIE